VVQEQQFSLFPKASGVHTFGPIELRAKVPLDGSKVQGFFSPTRSVKRLSNPITLNVKPRPDAVAGQWWLPAKDVKITDQWSGDPSAIDASDTITRTIEVSAIGVSVDQLPDIEPPKVDGLKFYANNTNRSSAANDAGIVSTAEVTWAVVPERNGEIKVPPVRLNWFNIDTASSEQAELPAQILTVSGVIEETVASDNQSVGNSESQSGRQNGSVSVNGSNLVNTDTVASRADQWLWALFGAIGVLCLQVLGFGLWRGFSGSSAKAVVADTQAQDSQTVPSLTAVRAAIKRGKLPEVQTSILAWAAELWPQSPPQNVLVVAERLEDAELSASLKLMDAALYGGSQVNVDLRSVESLLKAGARRHVDGGSIVSQGSQLPAL